MGTCNIKTHALSDKEPYMSGNHVAYFKRKLLVQRQELSVKVNRNLAEIKTMKGAQADIIDRSNTLMNFESVLASCRRYNQLIRDIDHALERIADNSYGFCCISGEPIGLKRLDILPCTNVSIKTLESMAAEE